jgi:hypothetical protein
MAKTSKRDATELGAGWIELGERRWAAARSLFEGAVAEEKTPEAFEGLSWAAWWLDDAETVFDARERAFRLYRSQGDAAGAALAQRSGFAANASSLANGGLGSDRHALGTRSGSDPGNNHRLQRTVWCPRD